MAGWLAAMSPVPAWPTYAPAPPAWLDTAGMGMLPGPFYGGPGGYLPVAYGGAGGPSGVPAYVVERAPGGTEPVPEPSSLGLLSLGLLALAARRRA